MSCEPLRDHWLRLTGIALLLAGLLSVGASAQLEVFQSPRDNLVSRGEPALIHGHTLVHVGFSNGSAAGPVGEACGPLGGDEICQWAVRFETTGNLKIVDVAWVPGVVEDDEPTDPATERTGTGGDAIAGELSRRRIATVAVAGTRGELRLVTPPPLGFLTKDGELSRVDPEGVVLARTPALGWSRLSASDANTCGLLSNGALRCAGAGFPDALPTGSFRRLAVGPSYGCVLDFEDRITCWGAVGEAPSARYRALAAGGGHVCGLLPSLEAECWGDVGPPEPGPFRALSAGDAHTCGLRFDSSVVCWGADGAGQVSDVPTDTGFRRIAAGGNHTCGIRSEGDTAECWGDDGFGQSTPTFPDEPYAEIAAGLRHSCAIRRSGRTDCWGDGSSGQTSPGSEAFETLALGRLWGCGIRRDRSATCWGTGVQGSDQLPDVPLPQLATGVGHSCVADSDGQLRCFSPDAGLDVVGSEPPGAFVQLDAADTYACALSEQGFAECWGDDLAGRTDPLGGPYTQVATGSFHACALRPDARVQCWGDDRLGQSTPRPGSFVKLSAGEHLTCGIRPNQRVECWGFAPLGKQGGPFIELPEGPFVDLSVGRDHACGVRPGGEIECWLGESLDREAPPGMFKGVAVGATHACAVGGDGTVDCFGEDFSGETSPPPLAFASVSVKGDGRLFPQAHSCGVTSEGALACWGSNFVSQAKPPFDNDADGLEDAVDNCPRDANRKQTDADADGVGDTCDNCPFFNTNQYDRDGDAVGDVCDACPDNPSASQRGEVCETTLSLVPSIFEPEGQVLRRAQRATELLAGAPAVPIEIGDFGAGVRRWLTRLLAAIASPPASAQGSGAPAYEVVLACPSHPIGRIELALVLPAEISSLDFGPGCRDLSEGGCSGASELHPRVNPDQSFLLLPPVPSGRPDAVYFALEGFEDPPGGGEQTLCDVGEINTLARIAVDQFPADGSNPSLTPELVGDVASDPAVQAAAAAAGVSFDGEPIQDDAGVEIPFAQYAFAVGADDAPIQFELRPTLGEATGASWDINLSSQAELFRATLGFIQPSGTSSIQFAMPGPSVDAGATVSTGPDVTLPRPDTLYVRFQGALPGDDPLDPTLVPLGGSTTLGTIQLGNPSGEPPVITLEGAAEVAGLPSGAPFEEPGGSLLTGDQALLTGSGATGEDFDGDGVQNETDNCVFTFNPDQANRGGFLSAIADTFGDRCQCGDLDDNGQILADGADLLALRRVIVGLDASEDSLALCSISDGSSCDLRDMIILERALLQLPGPTLISACRRAIPAGEEAN